MLNLRRSIFITFFSTNAATAVQFGVTVILSRLLTPAEVGIFSITVVFINIISVFRDFGVSSYLQQEKNLTPEKARAALGLLLTSSWSLAIAVYFGRSIIADYYGEPGIADVLVVLCISSAIVPFSSFYFALLARDLQAGKQAIVNSISTLVYAAACVTMAYSGMSYMAMAWANVVNIAVTIAIYWVIRPKNIPCIPLFKSWAAPLRFGGGAILGNVLEKVHASIPDLVLGKVSGAHDVGLYSRAYGLVNIFSQVAGPTISYNAVPYLARNHHSGQPLAPILSKSTSYLTGAAWPAFIVTALFSTEIINVLYGPQWVAAAPIAVLIALTAFVRFGYSLTSAGLMATGRPYLSSLTAAVSIVVRLGVIALIGATDIMSFAIALCIADIATVIVPAYMMSRYLGYSINQSLRAHIPSLKLGLACLITALAIKWALPIAWPDFIKLIIVAPAIFVTWITAIIILRHPLRDELPNIMRKLLPASLADKFNSLINRYQ